MKRISVEAALLLLLSLIGGAIANVVRSGDDETYLPWSTSIYGDPVVAPARPEPPAPAPGPGTPAESPGPGAPAEGNGSSTPEVGANGGSDVAVNPDPPVNHPPDPDGGTEVPEDDDDDGEFLKLGFEDALEELAAGATFVDARRSREYAEGHITGAVSISPYEQANLNEKIGFLRAEVPAEATVIVYCTASADCEDSAIMARQLRLAGFVDLRIYTGGFPEWDAKLKGDPRRASLITKGEEPGEVDG